MCCVLHQKIDLSGQRLWFEGRSRHGDIRGADQHAIVPRDCEHHAAIARARDHQRGVARQETAIQHDVGTLTESDYWHCGRLIHLPHGIAEYAGCVDNYLCAELEFSAGFQVTRDHLLFSQCDQLEIICNYCALFDGGSGQRDREARVVKLAVSVFNAAAKLVRLERGQSL